MHNVNGVIFWILFNLFVILMLLLDLLVFHRKEHTVQVKEALAWSAFWILLALGFNGLIYFWRGETAAVAFLTGYLIEKSLSVDNLFVFLAIFSHFSIPPLHQHKVLFWGILGALISRGLFILCGVELIERFHFTLYIMGAFLIVLGIKFIAKEEEEFDPHKSTILKLFRRFIPMTQQLHNGKFFVVEAGKRLATPLFAVLFIIETTDVIFALDSIPAILAITQDPFIVYTSNVMAILGLRALFFALAGVIGLFHYFKYGLAFILAFVGVKILIGDFYHIQIWTTLSVVAITIGLSVILSLLFPQRDKG